VHVPGKAFTLPPVFYPEATNFSTNLFSTN